MNIVIAEDDPIAQELLRESLLTDGHAVEAAGDGAAALALLQAGQARVLITDWEMPGMDGPELCRRVRQEVDRYVFIVLLTGRGRESLVEGLRAGADDFLTKPFDPLELSVRLSVAERVTALETRDLMIFSMAKLAESRDKDTGAHLDRVRRYCRLLAEELSRRASHAGVVDREFVRLIYVTSPLHDIGKVGIPDAILLKAAALTPAEREVMKSHTTIGAETLGAALREHPGARFLKMAHDIALGHHERFDGTGYPGGVKGEAIPLAARIVAVADVYDALRSPRVYKAAMTHAETRAKIVEGAGAHFDPAVVDAFLAVQADFEEVSTRLMDPPEETDMRLAA